MWCVRCWCWYFFLYIFSHIYVYCSKLKSVFLPTTTPHPFIPYGTARGARKNRKLTPITTLSLAHRSLMDGWMTNTLLLPFINCCETHTHTHTHTRYFMIRFTVSFLLLFSLLYPGRCCSKQRRSRSATARTPTPTGGAWWSAVLRFSAAAHPSDVFHFIFNEKR